MAIVFDSDAGTITGISVGGLPDGVVDAGTLATDSVTAAKIAANSVDSAELIDGSIDTAHLASGVGGKVLQVASSSALQKSGTWTDTSEHTMLSLAFTPVSASSTLYITGILTFQVYGAGNGNNFEMKMKTKEGSTDIIDGTGLHWNTSATNNEAHFTPTHVQKCSRAASSTSARTYIVTLQSQVASRRLQCNADYGGNHIEIIEVGA